MLRCKTETLGHSNKNYDNFGHFSYMLKAFIIVSSFFLSLFKILIDTILCSVCAGFNICFSVQSKNGEFFAIFSVVHFN